MKYFFTLFAIIFVAMLIVAPLTLFNDGEADSISNAFLTVLRDWRWISIMLGGAGGAAAVIVIVERVFEFFSNSNQG